MAVVLRYKTLSMKLGNVSAFALNKDVIEEHLERLVSMAFGWHLMKMLWLLKLEQFHKTCSFTWA